MYNVYVYTISLLLQLQNVILEEGEEFAGLLYTWRSLSRAVPAVCSHTHILKHTSLYVHACLQQLFGVFTKTWSMFLS